MATFTNQATLTYNGGTVNSNIVTGELVQVLTASKTAAAESYRTGDLVTYVVQLRSTGAAALTGLTVTDTLGTTNFPATGGTVQLTPLTYQPGTLRYFTNGVLQTAPAVTVLANGIRIEGISVPAGGVITLVYTTRVNAFADPSAEGTIENTVTVTGGTTDPDPGQPEAVVSADVALRNAGLADRNPSFRLALKHAKNVTTVRVRFTVDASTVSVTGLNGFQVLDQP